MQIAVYGREFQLSVIQYVQQFFNLLADKNIKLWVYHEFSVFLEGKIDYKQQIHSFNRYQELPKEINFLLSLGGDGTMLSAAAIVGDSGIPMAGINFGRLGFLASINKDKLEESLNELLKGNYDVESRVLLQAEIKAKDADETQIYAGLNDMTIVKKDSSAMITVKAYINDELLNAYWADGLIIATPTGSTAYSLSCGGPIVMPGSGNFIITPVSPHNLNVRPIVVNDTSVIKIEIESRSDTLLFSCDATTVNVDTNVTIVIRKAPFQIRLIRLYEESFLSTLRHKLLWGIDTRNY